MTSELEKLYEQLDVVMRESGQQLEPILDRIEELKKKDNG